MTTPSPDKLAIPETAVEAAVAGVRKYWMQQEEMTLADHEHQCAAMKIAIAAALHHIPDHGYAEGIEAAAKVAERLLKFADTTSSADIEIPAAIRALATPSPIEDVAGPGEAEIEAAAKIIDSNAFEGELQSSYWRSRRDNARDTARKVLAARRVRPSPVDEDALVRLQNEQWEFARKASVETDPLLKERWSGISVGMRSVLASLQSQRKG